jgi:hypothetical protein
LHAGLVRLHARKHTPSPVHLLPLSNTQICNTYCFSTAEMICERFSMLRLSVRYLLCWMLSWNFSHNLWQCYRTGGTYTYILLLIFSSVDRTSLSTLLHVMDVNKYSVPFGSTFSWLAKSANFCFTSCRQLDEVWLDRRHHQLDFRSIASYRCIWVLAWNCGTVPKHSLYVCLPHLSPSSFLCLKHVRE